MRCLAALLLLLPALALAQPTVESRTTTHEDSNVTSQSMDLPATVDSGDLLIGVNACDATCSATWDSTTAGTWTSIYHGATCVSGIDLAIYYINADGTEDGKTLEHSSSSAQSHSVVFRVSGWDSAQAPDDGSSLATQGGGGSTAPNAASLSPSWGSDNNLWITIAAWHDAETTLSPATAPTTGYGNVVELSEVGGFGNIGLATADKTATAASDDAGAWSLSASDRWCALTLAVKPSAAGGPSAALLRRRGR